MASTLSLDPSHLTPEQMSFALGKDFCPPVWSEMCFITPGTESREGVLLCLGEQFLFFFYFLPHFFPRAQHQLSQTLTGNRGQGKSSISTPNRKQAGLPLLCHCGLQALLAYRVTSRSPYSSHLNFHLFWVMSNKKYAKGIFPFPVQVQGHEFNPQNP